MTAGAVQKAAKRSLLWIVGWREHIARRRGEENERSIVAPEVRTIMVQVQLQRAAIAYGTSIHIIRAIVDIAVF